MCVALSYALCTIFQEACYRLKAVVRHVGRFVTSGHYVTSVHRERDWLLCDDLKVQLNASQGWEVVTEVVMTHDVTWLTSLMKNRRRWLIVLDDQSNVL